MEKSFEKQLRDFQAIASLESENPEGLSEKRAAALAEAVELTKTDEATQTQVYEIQKKKLDIMRKLHEQLKFLDNPKLETLGQGRTVSFDPNSKTYLMRAKGGKQTPITLGEVLTGSAWGQSYRLDSSVPRNIRKRYLVENTERELMEALDQQIAKTEAKSWFNQDTGKDDAYAAIAERITLPVLERGAGVIAEKLVSSLLTRIAIDHNLPFEVIQADAHADVEFKIDFIIRVKENDRGVSVNTHDGHDIGIQFTTKTSQEDIDHKKKQAARASRSLAVEEGETVEKIVVVSVPVDQVRVIVKNWQEEQKNKNSSIGGPDKLLQLDMQEKIFKGVLHDVFEEKIVDEMWEEVMGKKAA